jgi:hypothetical protein
MRSITLFVPGLFGACAADGGGSPVLTPAPHAPVLQRMLARGDRLSQISLSFEDALARLFGYEPARLPWGALGCWGEEGVRPEGFVLCLDPVHFKLGMTDGVPFGGASLQLTMDDARALAKSLEAHFVERGWRITVAVPERWYLHMPAPSELISAPLSQVVQRNAGLFKPTGADARRWLADITEAQMLLYAHPVNQAREARGLPSINSVWPWGAGELGTSLNPVHATPQPALIYTDHPLARGLAYAAGLSVHDVPETFAELEVLQGEVLIILDDTLQASQDGDYEDWNASIEGLEARWFAPLWRALVQGKINALKLDAAEAGAWTLSRHQTWRFWRKIKALEKI